MTTRAFEASAKDDDDELLRTIIATHDFRSRNTNHQRKQSTQKNRKTLK